MIATTSGLFAFLNRVEARPKKSLSQNFLIDSKIVQKILLTAEIEPTDTVLEIGPGPGGLTQALLQKGAHVFAVEKDALFARELSRLQTENKRLTAIQADILDWDLSPLPKSLKIVANLPYHITTPILEKLFKASFSSITIMVQKEVADRMIAVPGTKNFSPLSIFVQFYTEPKSAFDVPASSFYPAPKVDSTVIRLDPKIPPEVDKDLFFQLIRKAFQQRRKMISTSLSPLFSSEEVKEALLSIGANPDARPEALSLSLWAQLTKKFSERINPRPPAFFQSH